jgi:RNA 2',3'-cyclic 3'-phosphodiesterase
MTETKKRLFVAIPLPAEIMQRLEELQKKLKRFARDAKWVKTQSIHLTLKFLGYVDPAKIPAIEESLARISSETSPVAVLIKGCGFFPNPRRPSVLWTGIESNNLEPVQVKVENAMTALGFEKEDREFHPHLTLARFRDSHGLMYLAEEASKHNNEVYGEFTAKSFILYESILRREGAEYVRLHEFQLSSQ